MPDVMINLPITHDRSRRFSVGEHCGDTFVSGEDYDGLAVVIELRTDAEAKDVLRVLLAPKESTNA